MPSIPTWLWRTDTKVAPNNVLEEYQNDALPILERVQAQLRASAIPSPLLALSAFTLGAFASASTAVLYARYGRRLRTSDWVTPDLFARRRWVNGVVTSWVSLIYSERALARMLTLARPATVSATRTIFVYTIRLGWAGTGH